MPPRPPASPINRLSFDQATLTDRSSLSPDKYDDTHYKDEGIGSSISYGGAGSFIPPDSQSSPVQAPINRTPTSSIPPYEPERRSESLKSYSYPPNQSTYHRVGQNDQDRDQDEAALGLDPIQSTRMDTQQAEAHRWKTLLRDAGVDQGREGQDIDPDEHSKRGREGFWDNVERNTKSAFLRSIIHFTRGSPYLMIFLTMIPILALLWIPGLVALIIYKTSSKDGFSNPSIWKVGLVWWSIWLSLIYLGWYLCWLIASLGPRFLKSTVGKVSSDLKHYIAYLSAIQKYLAIFLWTLLVWLSWLGIIWNNFNDSSKYLIDGDQINPLLGSSNSTSTSSSNDETATSQALAQTGTDSLAIHMVTIGRFWLGLFFSATLLLGEKIVIQAIAWKFHSVTYADRISTSKFHIEVLATLYSHSKPSNSGAEDFSISTMSRAQAQQRSSRGSRLNQLEKKRERRSKKGGNSMLAASVEDLLPKKKIDQLGLHLPKWGHNPLKIQDGDDDPRDVVLNALDNQINTKKLARRIFFSFATLPNQDSVSSTLNSSEKSQERVREELNYSESPLRLNVQAISKCFPDFRTSESAFEMFDKNLNGDCTLEEMVSACEEARQERKMLYSSMRDVDSSVGNLDSVFMSVFLTIAMVIIAALISVKFSTLIASFGSALLGLSWLLSSSAQETLSSALFLFVKHPYDISDRIEVWSGGSLEGSFIVQEMSLLTTTFTTLSGEWTTMSHNVLCLKTIVNKRRSGSTLEPFNLEISYSTSYHQIESLRSKMSTWLSELPQRRHFLPGLDIKILSLGGTYNLSSRTIGAGVNNTNDQDSMLISMDIRYRSNLQSRELQNRRRNLWICQLKIFLAETEIFGVNGDPSSIKISKTSSVPYPPTIQDKYGSENGPPLGEERVKSVLGNGHRQYTFLDDENEDSQKGNVGKSPWTQTPTESWKLSQSGSIVRDGLTDETAFNTMNQSINHQNANEMQQRQKIWNGQR